MPLPNNRSSSPPPLFSPQRGVALGALSLSLFFLWQKKISSHHGGNGATDTIAVFHSSETTCVCSQQSWSDESSSEPARGRWSQNNIYFMLATRKSTYNDRYKLIIGVVATCYLRESTKTWHKDNFWNTNRPVCVLLGLLDHRLAGRAVSHIYEHTSNLFHS